MKKDIVGIPEIVEGLLRLYDTIHFEGIWTTQNDRGEKTEISFIWDRGGNEEKLLYIETIVIISRPKKAKAGIDVTFRTFSWNAGLLTYEHPIGFLAEVTLEKFLEDFERAKTIFDALLSAFVQNLPEPEEEVTSDV